MYGTRCRGIKQHGKSSSEKFSAASLNTKPSSWFLRGVIKDTLLSPIRISFVPPSVLSPVVSLCSPKELSSLNNHKNVKESEQIAVPNNRTIRNWDNCQPPDMPSH